MGFQDRYGLGVENQPVTVGIEMGAGQGFIQGVVNTADPGSGRCVDHMPDQVDTAKTVAGGRQGNISVPVQNPVEAIADLIGPVDMGGRGPKDPRPGNGQVLRF